MLNTQNNNEPPSILVDVGLNMFVDTVKLRKLPLPITDLDIEKLIWHFDMQVWSRDGTEDWNLSPRDVIEQIRGSLIHQKRVEIADPKFPILVAEYNSRFVILDGVHRLVKAYLNGNKSIKTKIIPVKYLSQKRFQS